MSSSNQDPTLDPCGCCEGVQALTPGSVENRPGLDALAYRVGTHGTFLETMKARLASQEFPALQDLGTRDPRDPSIALLDGWSTVLDVLSFYQERIANEHYLRTATERRSLLELARRIGYELSPGVAAGTWLAFQVDEAVGAPGEATIAERTLVQSIPGQDELPQKFETAEAIYAHKDWNALAPRQTRPQAIASGLTRLFLRGTTTNLKPGDALLLLGSERENLAAGTADAPEDWDLRFIKTITTDRVKNWTLVTWEKALGDSPYTEASTAPSVFAFRTRASLFGHNAPDARMLSTDARTLFGNDAFESKTHRWKNFENKSAEQGKVLLDSEYPAILEGSWVALVSGNNAELYKVSELTAAEAEDFGLASKVTELTFDTAEHLARFGLRSTNVFAQSDQLALAEEAIPEPVEGDSLVLDSVVSGLTEGRRLIVQGKRIRIRLGASSQPYKLISSDDGSIITELEAGEELIVLARPDDLSSTVKPWTVKQLLEVEDHHLELEGTLTLKKGQSVEFVVAAEKDEEVSEYAELSRVEANDAEHTRLVLREKLTNHFDRTTVSVFANVAAASHGETVASEVLGSGAGSKKFQSFELANVPLTHVSAATASGTESTLEVRVDGIKWDEADSFYELQPDDRQFVSRQADDGTVSIKFGDGKTGARLPTGVENVTATYRKGIGLDAMLKAEQLSLLMTKTLGVKSVLNPIAPSGAAGPESRDEARDNAPLTVLTLDRIVSVQDVEDFARAFAGIAKAQAALLWDGSRELVHVTVCGSAGAAVEQSSDLYKNLAAAIDGARHPDQPIAIDTYDSKTFGLEARILIEEAYLREDVFAEVSAVLQSAFSFEVRSLGQAISASEVLATIQSVAGVVAVDLETLGGQDPHQSPYLPARRATLMDDGATLPAQLVTIDPNDLTLEEMKS